MVSNGQIYVPRCDIIFICWVVVRILQTIQHIATIEVGILEARVMYLCIFFFDTDKLTCSTACLHAVQNLLTTKCSFSYLSFTTNIVVSYKQRQLTQYKQLVSYHGLSKFNLNLHHQYKQLVINRHIPYNSLWCNCVAC